MAPRARHAGRARAVPAHRGLPLGTPLRCLSVRIHRTPLGSRHRPRRLARAPLDARVSRWRHRDPQRHVYHLAPAAAVGWRIRATDMAAGSGEGQNVGPFVDGRSCRSQTRGRLTMSNAEVLGRFVWHELLTTDTAAAAAFYPKVLPWRTAPSSMPGYTIWMAGQAQIGGLMALPAEAGATPPHWLVYVGTPNVDTTCSQAQGLGARVVKPPADIPNVGRFAVLSDPQGATFALFTPGSGPPPGAPPAQGAFSWHELATTDVAAALRFYGTLFGWTKGPGHDMGTMGVYQIFEQAGTQVGGMCRPGSAQSAPSWLSYVHVAD